MNDNSVLRHTFDKAALLYHKARPCYPDELFSTLIEVTNLRNDSKLLEIGPGTGQATKPLAEKGFDITGIELGAALAKVARHELLEYKNVRIITGAFEEITLPVDSFDLVFAATSFHWIQHSLKYLKPYQVLKHKGHLAIIHTNHVSDEKGDDFFIASQSIYDHYDFNDKHQKPRLPNNKELKASDVDDHLFKRIHFQLFPIRITYSAIQFVELINTFSNHLAAPKKLQQDFIDEIENLINTSFHGTIDKHFSISLTVAKKI